MTLIDSPRITAADRRHWEIAARVDRINARADNERLDKLTVDAKQAVEQFVRDHGGRVYCGVSWGKDSVVAAHLVRLVAPAVPLVWVRVDPVENPDCPLVRDVFLDGWPGPYDEIVVDVGSRHRPDPGFALARSRYGAAYISGVRGDESWTRTRRMQAFGVASKNTLAPLGWWSALDVFAYLERHGLPVHPAYAMTMGGLLDRTRIRVATLGGSRGTGVGRREWELRYYPREMAQLTREGHLA